MMLFADIAGTALTVLVAADMAYTETKSNMTGNSTGAWPEESLSKNRTQKTTSQVFVVTSCFD